MEYLSATLLEVAPFKPGPLKLCALPIAVKNGVIEILEPRQILRRGAPAFHDWLEGGSAISTWLSRLMQWNSSPVGQHFPTPLGSASSFRADVGERGKQARSARAFSSGTSSSEASVWQPATRSRVRSLRARGRRERSSCLRLAEHT